MGGLDLPKSLGLATPANSWVPEKDIMAKLTELESKGIWKLKHAEENLTSAAWSLRSYLTASEAETLTQMISGLDFLQKQLRGRSE